MFRTTVLSTEQEEPSSYLYPSSDHFQVSAPPLSPTELPSFMLLLERVGRTLV